MDSGQDDPDKTIRYNLTVDDFIPQNGSCVTWSRKDSSNQYNRFTVEFMNRANNYEKESVTYEDTDDITERGVKQAPTINANYIYTKERAVVVAEAAARRNVVGKNQYQFKLGWAFCRLEPGDLVRITDEASGIENTVVIITDVQESADGLLAITAISWFQDDYDAAEYDVHEVDRPNIDFNVPPGDTDVPVIFQPPADLTTNGLELWLAAKGVDPESWGGCTVYVSDDNEYFRELGRITNTARFGPLASTITADDTTLEVTINGTMLSGTQQDAERANTLLWIDGECLSYQTATLLQNGNYQLSGLIRGQYNTTPAGHSAGAILVRCDEALLRAPFDKEDIGKTLWLKFCSYNIFGAAEQSLDEVDAYQYVLSAYYIPPVTNVAAYNRYRMIKDGVARYDIVVRWTPPDLQSYLEGQVWYKTDHGQTVNMPSTAGIPVSQLGFQGDWVFGGSGKNQVTIPQAVVGDTYRIAVTTKDEWGTATAPDFAPYTTITVALKTETPNTPDNFSIAFGSQCVCSWSEVTNSDIQFYEIRRDTNPGIESENMLGRTNGTSLAVTLTQRNGTLYLYAKSPSGKYSAPAILMYAKEAPIKPDKPVLSANLGSINITASAIPQGCNGINIYIDGDGETMVHVTNNTYTHSVEAGIYDVEVAYTDIFGEGEHSTSARIVIKKTIDAKLLEDEAINIAKVDATIQSALQDAVDSAKELVNVHGDINTINSRIEEIANYGEGIHNELVETQDSVTRTIARVDKNSADVTQLSQDVDSLQSTIESFHIEGDVGDTVEYLQSQITQNANSISQTVSKLNGNAGDDGQYHAISQLKQTADGLTSTVATKANASTEQQHYNTLTSSINQQADRITTIVTNLNDDDLAAENYSAIAQMQDNIELRVAKNGVVSALNLTPETARIKGKLISLDGDVSVSGYFWSNAVQAKSIAASKLNVDKLSSLTANVGTLSGGTITGTTLVGSTIKNASNTFSVDANGNIKGATINSGTINANVITQAGFQIKNATIIYGVVQSGGTIPLPSGYTANQCMWTVYPYDEHPSDDEYTLYRWFVKSDRVAFASYQKIVESETGTSYDYKAGPCNYRVIGIK